MSLQKAKLYNSLFILVNSKVGRLTVVVIRHETLSRSLTPSCPFNQEGKIALSLLCLSHGDAGRDSGNATNMNQCSKESRSFTNITVVMRLERSSVFSYCVPWQVVVT